MSDSRSPSAAAGRARFVPFKHFFATARVHLSQPAREVEDPEALSSAGGPLYWVSQGLLLCENLRWGPHDPDQRGRSLRLRLGPASWMPDNPFQFVGILDDRDHLHLGAARARSDGVA